MKCTTELTALILLILAFNCINVTSARAQNITWDVEESPIGDRVTLTGDGVGAFLHGNGDPTVVWYRIIIGCIYDDQSTETSRLFSRITFQFNNRIDALRLKDVFYSKEYPEDARIFLSSGRDDPSEYVNFGLPYEISMNMFASTVFMREEVAENHLITIESQQTAMPINESLRDFLRQFDKSDNLFISFSTVRGDESTSAGLFMIIHEAPNSVIGSMHDCLERPVFGSN